MFNWKKQEKTRGIEVSMDKEFTVIHDYEDRVLIILGKRHLDALLEKVCFDCKWVKKS